MYDDGARPDRGGHRDVDALAGRHPDRPGVVVRPEVLVPFASRETDGEREVHYAARQASARVGTGGVEARDDDEVRTARRSHEGRGRHEVDHRRETRGYDVGSEGLTSRTRQPDLRHTCAVASDAKREPID